MVSFGISGVEPSSSDMLLLLSWSLKFYLDVLL
jgi:hypothetical protein